MFPLWSGNWQHTNYSNLNHYTAGLVGRKVHQKTYDFNIIHIVNAQLGTDCNADTSLTTDLASTISWSTPNFSNAAAAFSFDAFNTIFPDPVSPGYASVGVNSDIEDPCDINLELTVPDAVTILENYDGTWDGVSCAQVDSYCDGTPVLNWIQPDSCLDFDTGSGTFTYDSC